MPPPTSITRRRFQFNLLTLIVLIVAHAAAFAIFQWLFPRDFLWVSAILALAIVLFWLLTHLVYRVVLMLSPIHTQIDATLAPTYNEASRPRAERDPNIDQLPEQPSLTPTIRP